jgi:hypothetical protein
VSGQAPDRSKALRQVVDPEVLARVGGLGLRARLLAEGALQGQHRSPHRGASVEFAQHREQQAVVFEAVSAAPAHHDAIEQLLGLERQRVVQADTDAAERERSDVPADDLGEEFERRLARLETEGTEMAQCET